VPREDADEFRAADAEPCSLCDSQRKGDFQVVVWSPVTARSPRRNFFKGLQKWIASLFRVGAHNLPAPVSRPC
jgi:hypothetical protein